MRKLLIAQHSETIANHLQRSLQDEWEVHICVDSYPVVDMMQYMRPEAMILDLNLQPKNGVTVLEEGQPFLPPAVLATTNYYDDELIETVHRLGVGAVVRIPFRTTYIREELDRLMSTCRERLHGVAWHLRALGVNQKLAGYRCLIVGIQLIAEDPGLLMKEVYADVGRLCSIDDIRRVERVIRTAVENAHENRNAETWKLYFNTDKRPSNKEFMMRIAEEL